LIHASELNVRAYGVFLSSVILQLCWKSGLVLLCWAGVDYLLVWQKFEGDLKPSPYYSSGKYFSTMHNEWMAGGFFLLLHGNVKTPMGEEEDLCVWGYNADEKVYTYHEFDSNGELIAATATVQGDTWTLAWEDRVNGKPVQARYTIKILSPTSFAFKLETASDGGAWSTALEGKATKQ
jgi:hypothetical protein